MMASFPSAPLVPFFFFLPLLLAGSDQESATGIVTVAALLPLVVAGVDLTGGFLDVSNGDFVDDGVNTGKSAAVGRWLVLTAET